MYISERVNTFQKLLLLLPQLRTSDICKRTQSLPPYNLFKIINKIDYVMGVTFSLNYQFREWVTPSYRPDLINFHHNLCNHSCFQLLHSGRTDSLSLTFFILLLRMFTDLFPFLSKRLNPNSDSLGEFYRFICCSSYWLYIYNPSLSSTFLVHCFFNSNQAQCSML